MHNKGKKPAKCKITLEKEERSDKLLQTNKIQKRKACTRVEGKKRSKDVMFEWLKRIRCRESTVEKLLNILIRQGEYTMSTLVEVQSQSVALTEAFAAEQTRQAAKNSALQSQIDTGVVALASIQSELDALKGGGQTPENQAVIDDISSKIVSVTNGLNGSAV